MSVTLPGSILPSTSRSTKSTASGSESAVATFPGSLLPSASRSTTSTSSSSAVATFSWSKFPSTVDTCTSTTLTWEYTGPPETLQFLLSSNASSQMTRTVSGKRASRAGSQVTTLATGVNAGATTWTWPKVNVTAGQYVVEVVGSGVSAVSPTFSVTDGADTSCLPAEVTSHSATSTTPSSGSSNTPVQSLSHGGPNVKAIVAGSVGAAAGVALLIIAIVAYKARGRRPRQPPPSSHPSNLESPQPEFPSMHIASATQGPSLSERNPRDEVNAHVNLHTNSLLVPNRRPPSSILSVPVTAMPPYMHNVQTREWEAGSIIDPEVSTLSRLSALSDAPSTAGLVETFSSSPPSYVTNPSIPPSYVTDAPQGARTPRSNHLSYASSS